MGHRAARGVIVLTVLTALALGVPAPAPATASVQPVEFSVTNPLSPGQTFTIKGDLFRPAGSPGCASSVLLLSHGLSYGRWGWDFEPGTYGDTYSVARSLAASGYASVAIDELGYDLSHGDNDSAQGYATKQPGQTDGYPLTVQSYAAMSSQIVARLRSGAYTLGGGAGAAFGQVGLVGHSAGTEISELTAGIFGNVDVLVATAYTHFPSNVLTDPPNTGVVEEFVAGDVVRAAQSDYEYFGTDPVTGADKRHVYMYSPDTADYDAAVATADRVRANLTPSGEIWSIGSQPSRWVMGAIDVPVALVLADKDWIFPYAFANDELSLFASAPSKALITAADSGHSFMLHHNAPATNAAIAAWLGQPSTGFGAC